ncbi:hypothetical protein D9M69_627100 [compost metagenome]
MDVARIKEHRRRSWICFVAIVVILLIAAAAPSLAAVGYGRPGGELQSIWFQRSGSISTVMALFGGLVIPYAYNKLHVPGTWGEDEGLHVLAEFQPRFKRAEAVAFALTIIGTVIWGYGDLLWSAFA